MISGVRDNLVVLACLRHGLTSAHGRGVDLLPIELLMALEVSLVRSSELVEFRRAFEATIDLLINEVRCTDGVLAVRLQEALRTLIESTP